jgi:hypothetical protein
MSKPTFNDPVFVRSDDTTRIAASVVEWNGAVVGGADLSVKLTNGNGESVLINVADWATIVGCVNREIERLS